MKPGDIALHKGLRVSIGEEYNPIHRPAWRGSPHEQWFSYVVVELGKSWSAVGAAPVSEFTEVLP